MSRTGALLAARFSFMPNRLGYCGPEENPAMLDYLAEGYSDRGLERNPKPVCGGLPLLRLHRRRKRHSGSIRLPRY